MVKKATDDRINPGNHDGASARVEIVQLRPIAGLKPIGSGHDHLFPIYPQSGSQYNLKCFGITEPAPPFGRCQGDITVIFDFFA